MMVEIWGDCAIKMGMDCPLNRGLQKFMCMHSLIGEVAVLILMKMMVKEYWSNSIRKNAI